MTGGWGKFPKRVRKAEPPDSYPSVRELPSWLGLSVGLLGLATGLLGLLIPLGKHPVAPYLFIGATISALFGGWILLVQTISLLRGAHRQFEARSDYTLKSRGPDLRFLQELVAAGREQIGWAHPDESVVHQRLRENPGVLKVYTLEKADGQNTFCGYLLIYPLKEEVGAEILAGKVRSESELSGQPLSPTFTKAPYLYIAMVLGTSKYSKPMVKEKLRSELIERLRQGDIKRVFARPGTPLGRSLMETYGFVPIAKDNGVWSISGVQLKNRLLAEESLGTVVVEPEGSPTQ
jgi:hypothetical protein